MNPNRLSARGVAESLGVLVGPKPSLFTFLVQKVVKSEQQSLKISIQNDNFLNAKPKIILRFSQNIRFRIHEKPKIEILSWVCHPFRTMTIHTIELFFGVVVYWESFIDTVLVPQKFKRVDAVDDYVGFVNANSQTLGFDVRFLPHDMVDSYMKTPTLKHLMPEIFVQEDFLLLGTYLGKIDVIASYQEDKIPTGQEIAEAKAKLTKFLPKEVLDQAGEMDYQLIGDGCNCCS